MRQKPPPVSFPDLDTGEISDVEFSPNGRRLAFGYGADAAVSVWDLTTGGLSWQRHVSGTDGRPLLFGRAGRILVIQCSDPDNNVPIWVCTIGGRLIEKLSGYEWSSGWLDKSGRFHVTEGYREKPEEMEATDVWDTKTWHQVDHIATEPGGPVNQPVLLTATGRIIRHPVLPDSSPILPGESEPAGVWWKHVPPLPFDRDGGYTASRGSYFVRLGGNGDNKGVVEVWDLRRKTRLWATVIKGESPRVAAISPDERTLAVGVIRGTVDFWDLRTGRFLHHTHCSDEVIRCITFSPNGRVLAATGGFDQADSGVMFLDAGTYKRLAVLKVAFPENDDAGKWTSLNPPWFAALPDRSFVASGSAIKLISTSGRKRDAPYIHRFWNPSRVRAALRECYAR